MCHKECPAPVRGGSGIVEERVETLGVERSIPGFFARPDGAPAPAVVILHDIWGANDFYHDLARRLAGEGFAALLPDLFVRQGPLPEQTREAAFARRARLDQTVALADIAGALRWVRDHPATTGRVGTMGFCLGGTFVMLAAARDPLPDAGVAFYGFPVIEKTLLTPAVPLDEARAGLVGSPLLLLWGDQDHGVGMENVAAYRAALEAAGTRHEAVVYPGLPHGFLTFDPAAPVATREAWARALAFLRAELSPA
ncbi:MAG: dienelactone hydrolase family protein [Chloroflexota bacterium]|nr:dienelactone hydrolase family protein [Chloroflexota bacterium]